MSFGEAASFSCCCSEPSVRFSLSAISPTASPISSNHIMGLAILNVKSLSFLPISPSRELINCFLLCSFNKVSVPLGGI